MKHVKFFFFIFTLLATCYIAHYSIKRNTLSPTKPLSSLTIATIEIQNSYKGFDTDIINDLTHRMTQKPILKTYSIDRTLHEIKKGILHCAIIPYQPVEKESELFFVTPIKISNNSQKKALVVSKSQPKLFNRIHATLLEMTEDGTLEDFAHKWNIT